MRPTTNIYYDVSRSLLHLANKVLEGTAQVIIAPNRLFLSFTWPFLASFILDGKMRPCKEGTSPKY